MPEQAVTLNWKLTALVKPKDYQECLVYGPCEGFMVATWKDLPMSRGFYLFAQYEPLDPEQAVFWMELPGTEEMCRLSHIASCFQMSTQQISEAEKPQILMK